MHRISFATGHMAAVMAAVCLIMLIDEGSYPIGWECSFDGAYLIEYVYLLGNGCSVVRGGRVACCPHGHYYEYQS